MRTLSFSTSKFKITERLIDQNTEVKNTSTVLNLSDEPIRVTYDKSEIQKLGSAIVSNTSLFASNAKALLIDIENIADPTNPSKDLVKEISKSWDKASKLFPQVEELKSLEMYRSPKEVCGNYELNLWFLKEKTRGRVHKEHSFNEIHLQVLGIGAMQKYLKQNYDSLYETVYMAPGVVHKPFFHQEGVYPWHSYDAITDCVWLAIEEHV